MRCHRILTATAAAIVVLGFGAACTAPAVADRAAHPRPSTPASVAMNQFNHQAALDVQAWSRSPIAAVWRTGFVPLQALTHDPIPQENPKSALILPPTMEALTLRTGFPAGPSHGRVQFPDGHTLTVPLVTAKQAFGKVATPRPPAAICEPGQPSNHDGECSLTVTGVRLGTTTLLTSRGRATVPAWLFTTSQWTQPISRVAVPLSAMTYGPMLRPVPSIDGMDGVTSLISVDGRRVTFALYGGECDVHIRPMAHETPTAVVVGATDDQASQACGAMAKIRVETVTLAKPLGNRPVLDIGVGGPLLIDARSLSIP